MNFFPAIECGHPDEIVMGTVKTFEGIANYDCDMVKEILFNTSVKSLKLNFSMFF